MLSRWNKSKELQEERKQRAVVFQPYLDHKRHTGSSLMSKITI